MMVESPASGIGKSRLKQALSFMEYSVPQKNGAEVKLMSWNGCYRPKVVRAWLPRSSSYNPASFESRSAHNLSTAKFCNRIIT